MKYLIVTKPIHTEKIVNWLNQNTNIDYYITTSKLELDMWDYDIGISYCCPYIIKTTEKKPWFNYHPGPLPRYSGLYNYANAIKNKSLVYGVTLHRMTDKIDTGPIIRKKMFRLKTIPINSNELGCIAHYHLFQLFKETIGDLYEKI